MNTLKPYLSKLPESLPVVVAQSLPETTSHIIIPIKYYVLIFQVCTILLFLLLLPPLTLKQKQFLAAPLLLCLCITPVIFSTSDVPHVLFACSCFGGASILRHFDIYFVRPWRTGREPTLSWDDLKRELWEPVRKVPMTKDQLKRHEQELQQERLSKKSYNPNTNNGKLDKSDKTEKSDGSSKPTQSNPEIKSVRAPRIDPHPKHWSAYLSQWILYGISWDFSIFIVSFFSSKGLAASSNASSLLFRIMFSNMIVYGALFFTYTTMIIWAAFTGNLIYNTEWTLVCHYLPIFATSPSEFWRQWHHFFQYIWVDLGAKPVLFLLQTYVSPKVNRKTAGFLEFALPILGVFFLSGLMHEYIAIGMWHEIPGHMTCFFMIQGLGTVISKMLYKRFGKNVYVPPIILIIMTWIFNFVTGELFLNPVLRHEGQQSVFKFSILIRVYNYLRSNGVF